MKRGALAAASEVLRRHLDDLPPGLLVVAPPADGFLSELAAASRTPAAVVALRQSVIDSLAPFAAETALTLGFGTSPPTPLRERRGEHSGRTSPPADGGGIGLPSPPAERGRGRGDRPTGALIYLPREKALAEWLVRQALARLRPGDPVWVVGENRAGGRSGGRRIAPWCPEVTKIDAARRCSLFTGALATPPAAPDAASLITWFEVDVDDAPLRLAGLPGVFASGRLDEGTALLLEVLPPIEGRILDFGSGCGVIGALIARRKPTAEVTLVDDFVLACEASRATLVGNRVRGTVQPADGLGRVNGPFDWIVSNPPFHQGAGTDYAVAEALVAQAPARLAPGGSLLIVANQFLDYGRRMKATFGNCETLADQRGFRVYRSVRRDRRPIGSRADGLTPT